MIQFRDSSFTALTYTPWNEAKPYTWIDLGHEGIIAIVFNEDHEVMDYITHNTPKETVQTLAHNPFVVVHEEYTEEPVIRALMDEHELYRDCFGIV